MGNLLNKIIFNAPHEGLYEKLDIDFIYIETEDNEKIAAHYINRYE